MNKLIGIGELLVDFSPNGDKYIPNAGGAPANVCAQVSLLNEDTVYLSQVGNDKYAKFLIEELNKVNVNTKNILLLDEYKTSLAYVNIDSLGNRTFKFERDNVSDLHFKDELLNNLVINDYDILEFGSVALNSLDNKKIHVKLINKFKEKGNVICFDPNLRFNLWNDINDLYNTVIDYIKKCDVLKISDEEISFITKIDIKTDDDLNKAINYLFSLGVKVILYTLGSKGAKIYLSDGRSYSHNGYKVNTIDTTGAGDSSFGGLISELLKYNIKSSNLLDNYIDYNKALNVSMICASQSTLKKGAIASYINKEELDNTLK